MGLDAVLAAGDLAGHAAALAALGVIDEAAAKVIGQLDRAELDDLIALRDVVVQVGGRVDPRDATTEERIQGHSGHSTPTSRTLRRTYLPAFLPSLQQPG